MEDKDYQSAMEAWKDAELESAPDLRPTPEMHRLVRAKHKPGRPQVVSSPWALGAAAAALVLVVALLALLLRSPALPGLPPGEPSLIAQRQGGEVSTADAGPGQKGPVEKGPGEKGRGPVAFNLLAFEYYEQDASTSVTIDLMDPPPQAPILTAAHNYRLRLEPARDLYLYVYQITSSGSLVQLLPNKVYSPAENPAGPEQAITLPAEPNWLYRDGPPGQERLVIIASPEPLAYLDEAYARYTREVDPDRRREALASLVEELESVAGTRPHGSAAWEFVIQIR